MSIEENLCAFIASVNALYQPVPGRSETGFDVDFQDLKKLSTSLKQSQAHETLAGQNSENKKKNRYKDILPFDATRVKLTGTDDDPNSDYINASFIKGAAGHDNYIASQGPLPHTVVDFWQMLWQYNVAVIVMVCREIEMGKMKCERYWSQKGETKDFGDITVTLSDLNELKDGYCLRTIKATRGNETRYVQQFHYTSWPDHGVPKTCFEILTLINHVREVQSYTKDTMTPLCVHCSAGCGRTGAVLAVDYVRNLLVNKNVPSTLRTYEIIADMRKQRPAIVQTRDQYEFVNAAISEMFQIYMQTQSISYKGFGLGYEQGAYVNVNISTPNGSVEQKGRESRPTTLNYENIQVVQRFQDKKTSPEASKIKITRRSNSQEEYPTDPPPSKPSRTAPNRSHAPRPVSVLVTGSQNMSKKSPDQLRKQSMSNVKTQLPRNLNIIDGIKSPPTMKETKKPTPPTKPKLNMIDPALKNSLSHGVKPTGERQLQNPPVGLKMAAEGKKLPPPKPRRSAKIHTHPLKAEDNDTGSNFSATGKNLQKHTKNHQYDEIVPSNSENKNNMVTEADYAELDHGVGIIRSNSNASIDRPLTPCRASTPPKLPVRTPESQMLLAEAPPALPMRTPESYLMVGGFRNFRTRLSPDDVEDDDLQTYEAVDSSTLPRAEPETQRKLSATAISGVSSNKFTAKAKGVFEKTTSAFSKLNATIAKSMEDESSPRPSSIEQRSPTYVAGPTMYGGSDMSFGKRLKKKVKGGRNFHYK